jgi:steroid 5-alpha reductase family enzyme
MTVFQIFLSAWVLCALLQGLLWRVQNARSEADIVDVGWAGSLGALALMYALVLDGALAGRICAALFAVTWSVRLGGYLYFNRVRVVGEDERYHALRVKWGQKAARNFFILFQAQALLAALLSIPFIVICISEEAPSALQLSFGVSLFAGSILGESLADRQLSSFRADPANRGKVCSLGLWKYSRHPNYFFEWLYWWSFVALGIFLPWGPLTLLGPALMYYFLRYLTGIPATEARALESRGENYRQYQERTSAFFPWFPLKEERGSDA